MRAIRIFLWLAIFAWGVGFGAKLFDLVVVAGAWSASPPESFSLLPYGKRYPIDPGDFFIPLSALIAAGSIGALVAGWKSRARVWLLVAVVSFAIIWALTPTIFWPMIRQLYGTAIGRVTATRPSHCSLPARGWFGTAFVWC